MKTIGIVTSSRSDYGIYQPILRALRREPDLETYLYATGMHLSPQFGHTIDMITANGDRVDERVDMLLASDTPEGVSKSMGAGVTAFAQAFGRFRPDLLMLLGDRFDMLPAGLAALPFRIPVAHIHGGELTQGAIDNSIRHSITKLSHLHFVATREYAARVAQLGEEPWRITVSGAPSLDNLDEMGLMDRAELEKKYAISLSQPTLLVTFHPVTLETDQTEWQISELLACLHQLDMPVVFTAANADTHHHEIDQKIAAYVSTRSNAYYVDNFGVHGYLSMLNIAAAMVGNTSSGIIEAASFGLPVVNIGTRQQGRVRGANVIDVDYSREEVKKGVQLALSGDFKRKIDNAENPYKFGNASQIIVQKLKEVIIDDRLIKKVFHDV